MKECFYSPIFASVRYSDNQEYDEIDYWRDEITSKEAVAYKDIINETIEHMKLRDEETTGLMEYFDSYNCDGNESMAAIIKNKVNYAYPSVQIIGDEMFGVMKMDINSPLTSAEENILKEYFTSQYSDGWGEGFEQREIEVFEGDLYVAFWSPTNFYMETSQEFRTHLQEEYQNQLKADMDIDIGDGLDMTMRM